MTEEEFERSRKFASVIDKVYRACMRKMDSNPRKGHHVEFRTSPDVVEVTLFKQDSSNASITLYVWSRPLQIEQFFKLLERMEKQGINAKIFEAFKDSKL